MLRLLVERNRKSEADVVAASSTAISTLDRDTIDSYRVLCRRGRYVNLRLTQASAEV